MSEQPTVWGTGSNKQASAKVALAEFLKNAPAHSDLLIANLPLYLRSVILAKILYVNEIYSRILPIPGVVMEFGVWWGANMSLLNSMRNVYEPYNFNRRVIGFDTFAGYPKPGERDGAFAEVATSGHDQLPEGYDKYLEEVLACHESENALEHIRKFQIVKGDVTQTVDRYLSDNPQTMVALAYLDVGMYDGTKHVLKALRPHLVPGSIIAMDSLNSSVFPGETQAFREVMGSEGWSIRRSQYLPDRSYVIVD
ncbi:MAG: crotonobetainyl-CoA--carnitine CoA-transferase [Betaproteobacteria bacterium]|nr:crotonobetainyl-CoA--carnitine CoA-transferase [Betaproteobacteria bacterium]